jgi:hypothetical protein
MPGSGERASTARLVASAAIACTFGMSEVGHDCLSRPPGAGPLYGPETVYGQAATGNYLRMPFNRCNLGSEQGLIDEPVLG